MFSIMFCIMFLLWFCSLVVLQSKHPVLSVCCVSSIFSFCKSQFHSSCWCGKRRTQYVNISFLYLVGFADHNHDSNHGSLYNELTAKDKHEINSLLQLVDWSIRRLLSRMTWHRRNQAWYHRRQIISSTCW